MSERLVKKNNVSFYIQDHPYWQSYENNTWEPGTFSILDKVLLPAHTMIDIGAWIGPIALYSASKINKCFAFEPDPIAFKELENNMSLNPVLSGKLTILNQAITDNGKSVHLFSRHSHGDSGSSLLKRVRSTNKSIQVESIRFDDFLAKNKVDKIDFIKIDIEGGEFFLLPQMLPYLAKAKPTILASIHFDALCEYLELEYLPFGFMRRIYRFIAPDKTWIKRRAHKKINELIYGLKFYNVYNEDLSPLQIDINNILFYQNIDMLLFSSSEL